MAGIIDPDKIKGLLDEEFEAPDIIGTVEGWRAWKVKRELPPFGMPPKLYSVVHNYYWNPRQRSRAECDRGLDDGRNGHIPGDSCACGFYSAKTLDHLRTIGYHTFDPNSEWVTVIGRVANWGKVIEGSLGWRAELSYPVELYVPFSAHHLAKPIEDAYGVPVKLLNVLRLDARPETAPPDTDPAIALNLALMAQNDEDESF